MANDFAMALELTKKIAATARGLSGGGGRNPAAAGSAGGALDNYIDRLDSLAMPPDATMVFGQLLAAADNASIPDALRMKRIERFATALGRILVRYHLQSRKSRSLETTIKAAYVKSQRDGRKAAVKRNEALGDAVALYYNTESDIKTQLDRLTLNIQAEKDMARFPDRKIITKTTAWPEYKKTWGDLMGLQVAVSLLRRFPEYSYLDFPALRQDLDRAIRWYAQGVKQPGKFDYNKAYKCLTNALQDMEMAFMRLTVRGRQ